MKFAEITYGARVAVVKLKSVDGITTRPEYLTNRRVGAVGTVEGYPAGWAGTLVKVRHDDTGELAVYFKSELVSPDELAEATASTPAPQAPEASAAATPPNLATPEQAKAAAPHVCQGIAITGSITEVASDALLASLPSPGAKAKFGITAALEACAGTSFHDQAKPFGELAELTALRTYSAPSSNLPFPEVLFIVYNGQESVAQYVYSALHSADSVGYKTVTLPLLNFINPEDATMEAVSSLLLEIHNALTAFQDKGATALELVVVLQPDLVVGEPKN